MQVTLSDFDYALPQELIASVPIITRDQSRLLVVNPHNLVDSNFNQLPDFINPGDLLVFNNSKVIKARVLGNKSSGGKIEVMLERILEDGYFIAHIRSNKTIKCGLEIFLPGGLSVVVVERLGDLFRLQIQGQGQGQNHSQTAIDLASYLDEYGTIPLPPYMERQAEDLDNERYQTVYAKHLGSVAAPTAGLHFTEQILQQLKDKGVKMAYVTLHVGSGTFKPVAVADISQHKMHQELYTINETTLATIKDVKANGGKVIAVGTTSLRTLESCALNNFHSGSHETDIFITPGFNFRVVDKLITNFHLPKSTLIMLVAAFVGLDRIQEAYQHAILHKYRFFSYGDAMLLNFKA